MGEHALLGASGAYKWLNCTPSARLEEQLPESTSEYADEGQLAHEIAELKLRKTFFNLDIKTFNDNLKKLQENPLYDPEMLEHTESYLEYILGIGHSFAFKPYIAAEKKLDYSFYVPDGFGTGDCIVIGGGSLHVIDFKYGKGVPVSADENPQMKLYALGALSEYSLLYYITDIKMTIVQPRLDSISEFNISADELRAWGDSIKPIAQAAFAGEGECNPGEWCRFCKVKAQCRARCEIHTALEDFKQMKPPLISNEEVGQILIKAKELSKWAADLEEYALAACLKGDEIPGWKAVEGRSVRQFISTENAFDRIIELGYKEAVLYERKPITLTAVEKLIGKKDFVNHLSDYVIMPPGKPALAPENDKRKAITAKTSATDDFKNIEINE